MEAFKEGLPPLQKEDFLGTYEAFRRKAEYEKQKAAYEKQNAVRRLFSEKPKDPVEGYQLRELQDKAGKAFKAAHPDLDREFIGNDGTRMSAKTSVEFRPDGTGTMKFELREKFTGNPDTDRVARESFHLVPGKGFIRDSELVSKANREEWKDPVSSDCFDEVDRVARSWAASAALRNEPLSRASDLTPILQRTDRALDAMDKDREQCDRLSAVKDEPHGAKEYAERVFQMRGIAEKGVLGSPARASVQYNAKRYDGLWKSVIDVLCQPVAFFERERAKIRQTPEEIRPMKELMQFAKEEAKLKKDAEAQKPEAYMKNFVEYALQNGYTKNQIADECRKHGVEVELGQRPVYDITVKRVADTYITVLNDKVNGAFNGGVRDSAKVEVSTPKGMFEKHYSEVSERIANNYVVEAGVSKKGLLSSTQNQVDFGRKIHDDGYGQFLDKITKVTGVSPLFVAQGFADAKEERRRRKEQSQSLNKKESSIRKKPTLKK